MKRDRKMQIKAGSADSKPNHELPPMIYKEIPVGIAESSIRGKYIDANEEFCRIVGYEKEQLLGLGIKDIIFEEDYPIVNMLYKQLAEGKIPSYALEKRYVRKDGTVVWVEAKRSLVRSSRGRALYTIGVVLDVTERKRNEERHREELENLVQQRTAALQELIQVLEKEIAERTQAEELLKSWAHIFENADWGIATALEDTFVMVNPTFAEMHGYTVEELIGHSIYDVLAPESHADTREKIRIAYDTGHHIFENKHIRKDGSSFPALVDSSVVRDHQDNVLYRAINIRDITEQKKAEEALRESEHKLKEAEGMAHFGYWEHDYQTDRTTWSTETFRILRISPEEQVLNAARTREFIHPQDRQRVHQVFDLAKSTGSRFDIEYRVLRSNGEVRIIHNQGEVMCDESGQPYRIFGVLQDVTERKQAEESLEESRQRLQQLSRRLVEVQEEERRAIARDLHDRVGQNLSALNLNLSMMKDQPSQDRTEQMETRLTDSLKLVAETTRLVRDLLNELRPVTLDAYGLKAALQEYIEEFTRRYKIKIMLDITNEPFPRLNPGLEITLLHIAQEALTNVARHAKADQATLSMWLEKNVVYLMVLDNGIGMNVSQSETHHISHGLKIMRERAEAFGGTIKVGSAEGKGAKVEVVIPIATKP
jgi:two-component system, NarL family, sensor histidine kinase UhpB